MKKILVALSAVMIMALGFQPTVSAQTVLGVVIKSNRVNGSLSMNGNGTQVFAEFSNFTSETVTVSWTITVNGQKLASGTCTVEPQDKCTTPRYAKTENFSCYDLDWSY